MNFKTGDLTFPSPMILETTCSTFSLICSIDASVGKMMDSFFEASLGKVRMFSFLLPSASLNGNDKSIRATRVLNNGNLRGGPGITFETSALFVFKDETDDTTTYLDIV